MFSRCQLPRPLGLPDFPWDTLNSARQLAAAHPEGMIDLSVGTPVDATPLAIQDALIAKADSPGYPLVVGTAAVHEAIHTWMRRRGMVTVPDSGVIPTTGSKEMVAWLPRILGVGPGDKVLYPDIAYPTYHVGALLAGAEPVAVDSSDLKSWPDDAVLVWLNSPSNPTGRVLDSGKLREIVDWANQRGVVVVSDECYAELPWSERYLEEGVPSLLGTDICRGELSGLLVVYSLSKQSNMAGYRAGVLAGDPVLVEAVVEARKHGGMMVPSPVQAAMVVALTDDEHVKAQRDIYRQRRESLLLGLEQQGFVSDPSNEAGLYLWVKQPNGWKANDVKQAENLGRQLVMWFAERGILVAPGDFYGENSEDYVRLALTASDAAIEQARERLSA